MLSIQIIAVPSSPYADMDNFVLLLTIKASYQFNWLISSQKHSSFISTCTRQFGVPSLLIIIDLSAFMLITFKIIEGIPKNTTMNHKNVQTGRKIKILKDSKMRVVLEEWIVRCAMDGKKNSITPSYFPNKNKPSPKPRKIKIVSPRLKEIRKKQIHLNPKSTWVEIKQSSWK